MAWAPFVSVIEQPGQGSGPAGYVTYSCVTYVGMTWPDPSDDTFVGTGFDAFNVHYSNMGEHDIIEFQKERCRTVARQKAFAQFQSNVAERGTSEHCNAVAVAIDAWLEMNGDF